MPRHRRRIAAVLVLVGGSTALALVLAHASSNTRSAAVRPGTSRLARESILEHQNGAAADGADTQAYADRAFPASEVTPSEVQGAIKANDKLQKKGPGASFGKWDFLGPDTLNVDKFGTQSFIKPTQWSGRETAVTMGNCPNSGNCTLFVGAAGGGVWRTNNALAKQPNWKPVSADIPTNAIGSVAVDPNDATGRTVYAGTGEGNASGDSEAGLGLYKSTDEGNHWSLVPGSVAVAANRSITWVAIQPGDPNHILIGTRSGTRGEASNSTSVGAVGAPL